MAPRSKLTISLGCTGEDDCGNAGETARNKSNNVIVERMENTTITLPRSPRLNADEL